MIRLAVWQKPKSNEARVYFNGFDPLERAVNLKAFAVKNDAGGYDILFRGYRESGLDDEERVRASYEAICAAVKKLNGGRAPQTFDELVELAGRVRERRARARADSLIRFSASSGAVKRGRKVH